MSGTLPSRMVEHAIGIAADAHAGECDKTGRPYFDHCRRVADSVPEGEATVVAYLHDVVEKSSDWTMGRLRAEGFPEAVVQAVDALTRREGEDDDAFARRAASDPLARDVKKADLQDNLHQARAAGLDGSRYVQTLDMLIREGFFDPARCEADGASRQREDGTGGAVDNRRSAPPAPGALGGTSARSQPAGRRKVRPRHNIC